MNYKIFMKLLKSFILIASLSLMLIGGISTHPVNAQIMEGLNKTAQEAQLPGKPAGGFEAAIGGVIGSVMGLIGSILFVYLLYGGFRWMIAGGDSKAVTEAQAIIRNAIIGIAIVVFAYALANFVVTTLSGVAANPTGVQGVAGQG